MDDLLSPLQKLEWRERAAITVPSGMFPWGYRVTKAGPTVSVYQRQTHAGLTRLIPAESRTAEQLQPAERALATVRLLLNDEMKALIDLYSIEIDSRSGRMVKKLVYVHKFVRKLLELADGDGDYILRELCVGNQSTHTIS